MGSIPTGMPPEMPEVSRSESFSKASPSRGELRIEDQASKRVEKQGQTDAQVRTERAFAPMRRLAVSPPRIALHEPPKLKPPPGSAPQQSYVTVEIHEARLISPQLRKFSIPDARTEAPERTVPQSLQRRERSLPDLPSKTVDSILHEGQNLRAEEDKVYTEPKFATLSKTRNVFKRFLRMFKPRTGG